MVRMTSRNVQRGANSSEEVICGSKVHGLSNTSPEPCIRAMTMPGFLSALDQMYELAAQPIPGTQAHVHERRSPPEQPAALQESSLHAPGA